METTISMTQKVTAAFRPPHPAPTGRGPPLKVVPWLVGHQMPKLLAAPNDGLS